MRRAIIWLLALVMPFQVLIAAYLDMRGPAHFHVESHQGEHRHDRGPDRQHGMNPDYGHYLPHFHAQHQVERHHHHTGDLSVVTVRDHASLELFSLKQETTSGWSGIILAAILASGVLLLLAQTPGGLTPRSEPLLQSRFPGPLERPPRTKPV